jgi:hypothetical protein
MPPVPLIGTLGALAIIGMAVQNSLQSYKESQSEEMRMRASTGWALDEVAHLLVDGFDADRDGSLAYDAVRGQGFIGEVLGVTASDHPVLDSLVPLARHADLDRDGVVTIVEVTRALRAFDVDRDGRLRDGELDAALQALAPQRVGAVRA